MNKKIINKKKTLNMVKLFIWQKYLAKEA